MWQVDQPDQPPVVLNGHQKEVTAVCWSHTLTEVYTCTCTCIYMYVWQCWCTQRVSVVYLLQVLRNIYVIDNM